jgi:UPF0755 protein
MMHHVASPVGGSSEPVKVVVPKGANAGQVGVKLRDQGLTRYTWVLPLMAKATGESGEIKAGEYLMSRNMSVKQMLEKLVKGDVAAVWVTIPEGYTVRQIADRLSERDLVNKQEFLAVARSSGKDYPKILDIHSQSLEGYLFPSTYLVPLQGNPRDIIAMMLDAFKTNVAMPLSEDFAHVSADQSEESRLAAMHRVVIVASLIEREAKVAKDRPLVSAVIWNRLRIGMKLDIDATVQYALGEHRDRLFYRDLAVRSAYNTYINPGLPPGPIANPGIDSIKAALHPADVSYLYYVALPDGSHKFSRTLEEHNAAVRWIRKGR